MSSVSELTRLVKSPHTKGKAWRERLLIQTKETATSTRQKHSCEVLFSLERTDIFLWHPHGSTEIEGATLQYIRVKVLG